MAEKSFDVVQFYWKLLQTTQSNPSDAIFDKVLIQALLILKNLIKNPDFQLVTDSATVKAELLQARQHLDQNLFLSDFLIQCFQVLVTKHLVYTQEDLESWESDPESFIQEEEADHWEYNVRACTEKVIVGLVSKERKILAPIAIQMLEAASGELFSVSTFRCRISYFDEGCCLLYDWTLRPEFI